MTHILKSKGFWKKTTTVDIFALLVDGKGDPYRYKFHHSNLHLCCCCCCCCCSCCWWNLQLATSLEVNKKDRVDKHKSPTVKWRICLCPWRDDQLKNDLHKSNMTGLCRPCKSFQSHQWIRTQQTSPTPESLAMNFCNQEFVQNPQEKQA